LVHARIGSFDELFGGVTGLKPPAMWHPSRRPFTSRGFGGFAAAFTH
jgi:hypothetical protein